MTDEIKISKKAIILLAIILSVVLTPVLIIAGSFNPEDAGSFNPEDEREIGYEFLENNSVVHIWNLQNDYFFDKSSGIQITNHFQEYWSKNIFCIGYYDGGEWNKIKCADKLENFDKDIQTDNLTYVNTTLWKDISYGNYDLRLAVNYYLGLDDKTLSVTFYGKNIGIEIPFDLGFAWKIAEVDVPFNGTDDKILIDETEYLLNGTYNLILKDMNEAEFKIYDGCRYLKVGWDESVNYAVKMYGNENQEDFYIAVLINAGHFNPNQEKSILFSWIDAGECTGGEKKCSNYGEAECEWCGCIWEFGSCVGGYTPCEWIGEYDCEDCGCTWESGPENFYVNVGDTWRLAEYVYVNVGDTWQSVEVVRVNVADTWRTIFQI
jgi:hypothetical protein